MPPTDNTLITYLAMALGGVSSVLVGLLSWQAKRQIRRVDEIQRYAVSRKEFNHLQSIIREELRSLHDEMHGDFQRMHGRIDKVLEGLASRPKDN